MIERLLGTAQQLPVATFLLLATVATSLAAFRNPLLMERFALRPNQFVYHRKHYQVITSGLIHANWPHLILNMVTFYFFAFDLEHGILRYEVLAYKDAAETPTLVYILAHGKFFILYLGSMVLADFTTILRQKDNPAYSAVGASGALSGVVLAYILLAPAFNNGLDIMIFGVVPGWLYALLFVVGSYFSSRSRQDDGIAHEAHLWGSVAGIFFTVIMFPKASWLFVENVAGFVNGLF